jgi:hypothetical protein
MLNPFFLQGSKSEQGLLQDLMNECIQMHGIDVYYLPRLYVTKRKVIREVIESQFTSAFPLEAYVDNYEGYEGAGTLLSKFGIKPELDLNLIISKERFSNYIAPLIQNIPDIELPSRPKEGDLIWLPLGDRLFEIKYVDHETPFYQLQKNYVYGLRCELFRYQDEIIDTGYSFIDETVKNEIYTEIYQLIGIGITATLTGTIVNGGVTSVIVKNRGEGYTGAPTVEFSASSNITATGIATMIGGIVDLCEPDESKFRVQGVEISNPGFGYTVPPSVAFYGGGGVGAVAEATIADGVLGITSITNPGSGYTSEPTITVIGIASTTAILRGVIQNGSLTQIRIVRGGIGYTAVPEIIVGNPSSSASGTFNYNEIVSGNITGNSARVKQWDKPTNILQVGNMTGSFVAGEVITGAESGAQYTVQSGITTMSVTDYQQIGVSINPFAQNNDIQIEADKVIDDTEYNIFGRI